MTVHDCALNLFVNCLTRDDYLLALGFGAERVFANVKARMTGHVTSPSHAEKLARLLWRSVLSHFAGAAADSDRGLLRRGQSSSMALAAWAKVPLRGHCRPQYCRLTSKAHIPVEGYAAILSR